MNYEEAKSYLTNAERTGVELGLERMGVLLDLLGRPERNFKIVHVAGTNGKGSVTAYLTAVLAAAGYKTGTYNSPSVFCYNERFLIDSKPANNDVVARYATEVKEVIDAENAGRKVRGEERLTPTVFELETAVALAMFRGEGVGICVLETGLGGRWDATNAVEDKLLSVITRIGLDHCALLGDTLEEVAAEKAAIIRKDVVTIKQSGEVMEQIKRPYVTTDNVKKYFCPNVSVAEKARLIGGDLTGQTFLLDGEEYSIKMLGAHQLENAALAVAAINRLRELGVEVPTDAIRRGLANTVWRARFEVVKSYEQTFDVPKTCDKTLIYDGSHNPQGAKTLADGIRLYLRGKRVKLVIGVLKDKDAGGILDELCAVADGISTVTPPSPRAMRAEELAIIARQKSRACVNDTQQNEIKQFEDIKAAVKDALEDDFDAVVLCGSLTLFEGL